MVRPVHHYFAQEQDSLVCTQLKLCTYKARQVLTGLILLLINSNTYAKAKQSLCRILSRIEIGGGSHRS